jgi:hypothetical protein
MLNNDWGESIDNEKPIISGEKCGAYGLKRGEPLLIEAELLHEGLCLCLMCSSR